MAAKKIGISRDLIIHPGETIADVLEERGITHRVNWRRVQAFLRLT